MSSTSLSEQAARSAVSDLKLPHSEKCSGSPVLPFLCFLSLPSVGRGVVFFGDCLCYCRLSFSTYFCTYALC